MLEGLIQTYVESFGRGWSPRDERDPRFRDSPSLQSALSSLTSNQGEKSYVQKRDGRLRRGFRPKRLREC